MRKEFRELIPLQEAKSIISGHPPRLREEDGFLKAPGTAFWRRGSSLEWMSLVAHRASMDGYAVVRGYDRIQRGQARHPPPGRMRSHGKAS